MANDLMVREMVYNLANGEEMRLSMQVVKKYLVQGRAEFVTEQELVYFMHECKARKLNPFLKECWLIKYSPKDNAQIVESIHHKRNRARRHPDCQGWSKGILYVDEKGEVNQSIYPMLPSDDCRLIGGWFSATPKGWTEPFFHSVSLASVIKRKKDGGLTAFWTAEKQPQQVMKVAESQGLSALWGDEIGNAVIPEEVGGIDFEREAPPQPGPEIIIKPHIPTPSPDGDRPNTSVSESPISPDLPENADITPPDPFLGERFDPAAQPDPPVKNWWDNELNWKHKKALPFMMTVLLGRGQALIPFIIEQPDGSIITVDDQYAELMRNLSKQNPGAVMSLDRACDPKKRAIGSKLISNLGLSDDDVDAIVFGDIAAWINAHPVVPAADSIEVDDEGNAMPDAMPDDMPIGGKDGPMNPMADGPHPDDDPFPDAQVQVALEKLPAIPDDMAGQMLVVANRIMAEFTPEVSLKAFQKCGMTAWPALLGEMGTLLDACYAIQDGKF